MQGRGMPLAEGSAAIGVVTASPAAKAHVCATCGKQYQRNTHLRRHEATHVEAFRFKCQYCRKPFARGDVCRKHALGCAKNFGHDQAPESRRGQKPRACEACSRSKLSCDKESPCGRCVARNLACRFREGGAAPECGGDASSEGHRRAGADMSFLRAFTDPKAETMLDSFTNNQVVNEDIPEMDLDVDVEPTGDSSPELGDEDLLFTPWAFPPFFGERQDEGGGSGATTPRGLGSSVPALRADASGTLERASGAIVRELTALHSTLFATDPSYGAAAYDGEVARSVFAAANLRSFTNTYFRLSHIYVPLVHMPSFGTEETSTSLTVAVVLAGASRQPPRDDALSAKGFFRIAEEYAFRHLEELMAREGPSVEALRATPSRALLEALQAAVLINQLQWLMNSVETQRRSRTRRLPALVSVVRRLGLSRTGHDARATPAQFVHREACIRVATWVALADWHQCGMFHVPPTVSVKEMRCDLPCALELWDRQYVTEEDVELHRQRRLRSARCTSVRDFVEVLMRERWGGVQAFPCDSVTLSGLEMSIFAMSCVTASAHLTSTLPVASASILRAIARWQELWEATTAKLDRNSYHVTALSEQCGEFCCLLRKVIQVSVSGGEQPAYLERVGHDSIAELYDFILEH